MLAPVVLHVVTPTEAEPLRRAITTRLRTGHAFFSLTAPMVLSRHILLTCHQFQVVWSHAVANLAKVIPFQALRGFANKVMVGEYRVSDDGEIAIPSLTQRPSVEPTGLGFLDSHPEPLFRRGICFTERLAFGTAAPLLVMHVAKAIAVNGSVAIGGATGSVTLRTHRKVPSFGVMQPGVDASRLPSILPERAFA